VIFLTLGLVPITEGENINIATEQVVNNIRKAGLTLRPGACVFVTAVTFLPSRYLATIRDFHRAVA
jgi:nucleoside recognition membrane protein YjiH